MFKSIITLLLLVFCSIFTSAQKYDLVLNAEEVIKKGIEANDAEKYDEALTLYQSIDKNDPKYITALYEQAYTYNNSKEYKECIRVCEEGLKISPNPNKHEFYNVLLVALDLLNEDERALEVANTAIKEFPNYHLLNYNKALTLVKIENYQEAFESAKEAIRKNPYHFNSHFLIGELAARQKEYTKSAMATATAILLDIQHVSAINALQQLSDVLLLTFEFDPSDLELSEKGKDDFSKIDKIIESKHALDKKYKTDSDINHKLVNQIHAMIELLQKDDKKAGWFSKTYLPLFLKIKEEDRFKSFSEYLFVPSTVEAYQKKLSKNIKELKAFNEWFITNWTEMNSEIEINNENKNRFFYSNGITEGIGELKNDQLAGEWELFESGNGNLSAIGAFDENGKTGEWRHFYSDGKLKEKTNYVNGKAEGESLFYNENGILQSKSQYKNDELDGLLITYDWHGLKSVEETVIQGLTDGTYKEFYPNGELSYSVGVKDGKTSGIAIEYYPNKQVSKELNFEDGKLNGKAVYYYENKQVSGEYVYINNVENGPFVNYFQNGNLRTKGMLKDGEIQGVTKAYNSDGTLYRVSDFDEKNTGKSLFYNRNGNVIREEESKKGEIVSYKCFNDDGKILSEGQKKNKKFYYDKRLPDGVKVVEGNYMVSSGGQTGLWKYYSDYGLLKSEIEFDNNGVEVFQKNYFPNGNLEVEMKTIETEPLQQWITYYHENKEIASNGWMLNGKKHGKWEYFDVLGILIEISGFSNGQLDGTNYVYHPNGALSYKLVYQMDDLQKMYVYDTLGTEIQKLDFMADKLTDFEGKDFFGNVFVKYSKIGDWYEGDYIEYYGNNKLKTEGLYKNNQKQGVWKSYYPSGSLKDEMFYENGVVNGIGKQYHKNGKLIAENNYEYGFINGTIVYFGENGHKTRSYSYINGVLDGEAKYYDPNSVLQMVRYYKMGKIIGHSYLGADGKLIEMISVNANGNESIETKFANGKTSRRYKLVFGQFDGAYEQFYENGQLENIVNYQMGLKQGGYKEYSENGIVIVECNYDFDRINGPYKEFYPNGQLKLEQNYVFDALYGKATYYDENGKKTLTRQYYNGQIVDEK